MAVKPETSLFLQNGIRWARNVRFGVFTWDLFAIACFLDILFSRFTVGVFTGVWYRLSSYV